MLRITIPDADFFDEGNSRFITVKGCELQLEHSLVSVARWESKWKKPFLSSEGRTRNETIDYVRCMTITQNVDPNVYLALTDQNITEVNKYITDPMTATTFRENNRPPSRRVLTAEILYYKMTEYGIWKECEKWHLNRLITLIRVCDEKSRPGKKMSRRESASQYQALNQARRRRTGSKG